jgi:hypothetical protein
LQIVERRRTDGGHESSLDVLNEDTECIAAARIGSEDQVSKAVITFFGDFDRFSAISTNLRRFRPIFGDFDQSLGISTSLWGFRPIFSDIDLHILGD